jgi:hypothetical protein
MSTTSYELQPGDWVAGRYVILEEIGRGGFGIVYRALQEGIKRPVALKIVRKLSHEIKGFNLIEAFRQEALHTSRLKHPNNLTLFDFGQTDDGMLFLVTEFLEGETLYERMWRLKRVPPELSAHIIKQVAKGLGEAHGMGIIHGDLKPANVFLCEVSGERDFVKLLDFGIAKIIGEVDPAGLGTPEYMSPEQFAGRPLLAASDVYSVGVILYEMLTGRRPFESQSTQQLAQQHQYEPLPPLSPELAALPLGEVLLRATAKDPGDRYVDGLELFHALDAAGEGRKRAARALEDTRTPPPRQLSRALRINALSRTAITPSLLRDEPSAPASEPRGAEGDEGLPLPLVGRQEERRRLLELIEALYQDRQGRVLWLGGPAGSGKTRLLRWLRDELAAAEEIRVGAASWRENPPQPFEALAEALAQALGQPRKLALHYDLKRLERAAAQLLERPLSREERGALRLLFAHETTQANPNEVEAVAWLLHALGKAGPLVLLLDHHRWCRPEAMGVLEALARLLAQKPAAVLVVAAVRREALPLMGREAWRILGMVEGEDAAQAMRLTPLPMEDTFQLAREIFALEIQESALRGAPSVALLEELAARSFGNPLYLHQLIQHVIEQELLTPSLEGISLTQGVAGERLIPPRFASLMRQRLKHLTSQHELGRDLEYLLLCCAVLGQDFHRALLERMLQMEADAGYTRAVEVRRNLDALLDALSQEDILQQRVGPRLQFLQPLMHQALLERVGKGDGADLHRRAAQTKHQHYAARGELEQHAVEIGIHYELASEPLEAIRFLQDAARVHLEHGELRVAAGLLERCVRQAQQQRPLEQLHLRLIVALTRLKMRMGEAADVEALLLLGTRLSVEQGDQGAQRDLLLLSGLHAALHGDLERANQTLHEAADAYAAAPLGEPSDEVTRRTLLGLLLLLEPLPAPMGQATASLHRARVLRALGRRAQADDALEEAHRLFLQMGSRWGVGHCLLEAQRALVAAGEPLDLPALVAATGCLRALRSALEELRASIKEQLLSPQRDPEQLLALLEDAERVGEPYLLIQAHLAIGRARASLGADAQAAEHFLRALALSRARGATPLQIESQMEHARARLRRGDHVGASRDLYEALKLARQIGALALLPALQLLYGEIEEVRGELAQALEWYAHAHERAEADADARLQLLAHALRARLVRHKDSPLHLVAARTHLQLAQRLLAAPEAAPPELHQATEALAVAYHRQGQARAAQSLLQQAAAGWDLLGRPHEVERLQTLQARLALPAPPEGAPR